MFVSDDENGFTIWNDPRCDTQPVSCAQAQFLAQYPAQVHAAVTAYRDEMCIRDRKYADTIRFCTQSLQFLLEKHASPNIKNHLSSYYLKAVSYTHLELLWN